MVHRIVSPGDLKEPFDADRCMARCVVAGLLLGAVLILFQSHGCGGDAGRTMAIPATHSHQDARNGPKAAMDMDSNGAPGAPKGAHDG